MNLKPLSDEKLRSNTKSLVKIERGVLIAILWHLREIERRRAHGKAGATEALESTRGAAGECRTVCSGN